MSFDNDIEIVKENKCYKCSNSVCGIYSQTVWDDKLNLVLAMWGGQDLNLVINDPKSKIYELAQGIFETHLDALCSYIDAESRKTDLIAREIPRNRVKIIFFDQTNEHWIVDDAVITDDMLLIVHHSARSKSNTIWGIYNPKLHQLYNEYLMVRDELNKVNNKLKLELSGKTT